MKSNIFYTTATLLFIIVFSSCKKERYDCNGPILDFEMAQVNGDSSLTCTKCMEGYIKFSVIDPTVEVIKWRIGSDEREFIERSFSLFFENMVGQEILVTLWVEKYETNENCEITYYRDSITKTLEFISYFESQIFGKYKGHTLDNPNEEFVVEIIDTLRMTNHYDIVYCTPFEDPPLAYRVMRGLPKDCINMEYACDYPLFRPSYDKFYFEKRGLDDECLAVHGRGYLDKDNPNKITIDYKLFDKYVGMDRYETDHRFIGYRIN